MKVLLKLFATLTAHLPVEARRAGQVQVELEPGTTVAGLIELRRLPPALCTMVLVNGEFLHASDLDRELSNGDTVAIWPPVGGG